VLLTINKLHLTGLDPAVTQYRFARIWPAVRHPGKSKGEVGDSAAFCTLRCTLHQRSKHTHIHSANAEYPRKTPLQSSTRTPSSNRMLTRAMRGAHLTLRGITFGDGLHRSAVLETKRGAESVFARVTCCLGASSGQQLHSFFSTTSQPAQHISLRGQREIKASGSSRLWISTVVPWRAWALVAAWSSSCSIDGPHPLARPCFLGVNKAGPPRRHLVRTKIMRLLARPRYFAPVFPNPIARCTKQKIDLRPTPPTPPRCSSLPSRVSGADVFVHCLSLPDRSRPPPVAISPSQPPSRDRSHSIPTRPRGHHT
jgi:hypothetical protein